jgi:hypothetical protein
VFTHRPLRDADRVLGRTNTAWQTWLEHDTFDDYWRSLSLRGRFAEIDLPALHITGWFTATSGASCSTGAAWSTSRPRRTGSGWSAARGTTPAPAPRNGIWAGATSATGRWWRWSTCTRASSTAG